MESLSVFSLANSREYLSKRQICFLELKSEPTRNPRLAK
jgi:hypothetical protein